MKTFLSALLLVAVGALSGCAAPSPPLLKERPVVDAKTDSTPERNDIGRPIENIRRGLRGVIFTRYLKAQRADPTLSGRVVFEFLVLPSGKVAHCRIVSSELHILDLENDLAAACARIDFGVMPVAETMVTWPVEFSSLSGSGPGIDSKVQVSDNPAPGLICPNYREVMLSAKFPKEALLQGLESGNAVVQFTVATDGRTEDIRVLQTTNLVFATAALALVEQLRCNGAEQKLRLRVPVVYRRS